MSELPVGWAEATISEIASISPKSVLDDDLEVGFVPMSHAPTNFRDPLRYEPRTWSEVKNAYTHFLDGDVIFAKVTPCFENGKAALVSGLPNAAGAGSSEFHVLRPVASAVSPGYLLAVIKSADFLRDGEESMTGAVGLRRVPRVFVENFPVRLPPTAEQKRIAQKLDELLAQVDALKARIGAIPALLKRFRQSVLAAATLGILTKEWRERQKHDFAESVTSLEFREKLADKRAELWQGRGRYRPAITSEQVEASEFLSIPDSWYRGTLDEVTWSVKDGPHFSPKYENAGIRFISGGNIRPAKIDLSTGKYISKELHGELSLRCKPEYLDILYTKGGTTGIAAVNRTKDDFNVWVHVAVLKPLPTALINPFFLELTLNSSECYAQSQRYTHGVGNQDLGLTRMIKIVLPVPPEAEQTEIVRRVEQLFAFADQLEAKVAVAKQRIDMLTQSILAKAFRGELVPQDPNDEPASVLLERIRTQRNVAPKPKRGRKPRSVAKKVFD
ncbi:MAG: restriction endonuclease subunit S [Rhodanobacter sp.]